MNAFVVKAICRRIQQRYGSNQAAATAAGVRPSVWSEYCSDNHPDTTIPLHRLLLVASAEERRMFADMLTGDEEPAEADIFSEAAEAVEGAADLLREARQAKADGVYTPSEKRRIRERAIDAKAKLDDVIRATDFDGDSYRYTGGRLRTV